MNNRTSLRRYFAKEQEMYAALEQSRPDLPKHDHGLAHWLRRTRRSWRSLTNDHVHIPDAFLEPYPFPKQRFVESDTAQDHGPDDVGSPNAQLKYQLRGHNVLRELDRCAKLFPETMNPNKEFGILELSSGACGGAEVAHHFGNSYQATDFLQGKGSAYRAIHQSLGLDCIDFNGGELPYRFDDASFDHVLCFQAIDAYGPEEQYPEFISEMLRIARQKVVIIFNPGIKGKKGSAENSYEKLIRVPLEKLYRSPEFSLCPSTGSPALILHSKAEAIASC